MKRPAIKPVMYATEKKRPSENLFRRPSYIEDTLPASTHPHGGTQRQVVGQVLPRFLAVQGGVEDIEIARIDAVQAQHGHTGGESFRQLAVAVEENFGQPQGAADIECRFVPPVVKVAGQYQWGFRRDVGGYVLENRHILFDAVAFQKVEVGAKADDGHFPAVG